jgi:hypothetical protein
LTLSPFCKPVADRPGLAGEVPKADTPPSADTVTGAGFTVSVAGLPNANA